MDISDIVTAEFETVDVDARVSAFEGTIRNSPARAVVVTEDGEYRGLVTERQLVGGRIDPATKAGGLVWHVARVRPTDDIRAVAARLIGSSARALPVFGGEEVVGIVTTEAILGKVQPYLGVLTVADVYSPEPVTVTPETTLGEALHVFRERGITHLPVVEDGSLRGLVSLVDVIRFAGREMRRGQGGSSSFAAGGSESGRGADSHGGFGERAGEIDRMLDLPVADVMTDVVETVVPDSPLDEAVDRMLDADVGSLVVVDGDEPVGIVTSTDVLESLTWNGESRIPVQITNVDLLDDITEAEVADMIESVAGKYSRMRILEANVFLHEHDERFRGTPLVMARIRLFTDRGHFVGTGEGYGASHALHLARNVLEREILDGKEYALTKKHPTPEELTRMLGWWLTGSPRRR